MIYKPRWVKKLTFVMMAMAMCCLNRSALASVLRPKLSIIVQIPSPDVQIQIVNRSKEFISYWIKGDYNEALTYVHSNSRYLSPHVHSKWIKYLYHHHHEYVLSYYSTYKKKLPEVIPKQFTFMPETGYFYAWCGGIFLNWPKHPNNAPHSVQGKVAILRFLLEGRPFYQVWAIDPRDQRWKCIHYPFDLDQDQFDKIMAYNENMERTLAR